MTHVHEDIGAYVLGAPRRRRRSGACARTCERARTCAAAHAELAGLPALLDLAVVTGATDEEPLPPAIEERLLDRFARERGRAAAARGAGARGSRLASPSALAGAAVAVAALIFGLELPAQRPAARRRQYQLAFERDRPRAGQRQRARRAAHDRGRHRRAPVGQQPAGRAADVYEVFCDAQGWSASAGTFRVDAQGNALRDPHHRGQARASTTGSASSAASTCRAGKIETYDILGAQALN